MRKKRDEIKIKDVHKAKGWRLRNLCITIPVIKNNSILKKMAFFQMGIKNSCIC
jgi:hypothetical protein